MCNQVSIHYSNGTRDAVRGLAKLVGRPGSGEDEAFLRDPKTFFDDASAELMRREVALRKAQAALRVPAAADASLYQGETVTVSFDEYMRLKACADVVSGFSF